MAGLLNKLYGPGSAAAGGHLAGLQQNPMFMAGLMGLTQSAGGGNAFPAMGTGYQMALAGQRAAQQEQLQALQMQQLQDAVAERDRRRAEMQGFLASEPGKGLLASMGLTDAPTGLIEDILPGVMAARAKPVAPIALEREVELVNRARAAEGLPPLDSKGIQALASGMNIYAGNSAPNPIDEAMAEHGVEQVQAGIDSANAAREQIALGDRMLQVFAASGGATGGWEPFKMNVARYLGFSDEMAEALPFQELFNTQAGNIVMSRIQETKGSVSDAEMAYFREISPGIGQQPFSNFVLVRWMQDEARMRIAKANARENWLYQNRSLRGFEDAWAKQAPALTTLPELRQEFDALMAQSQATPVSAATTPVPTPPSTPVAPAAAVQLPPGWEDEVHPDDVEEIRRLQQGGSPM